MPKIYVVDENDVVIGVKEKTEVEDHEFNRVTGLWIKNSKGEILLAQRKRTKRYDPGKWGPAVAGTVEEGETYESNIIKEAEEELGLRDLEMTIGPKERVTWAEHRYFAHWFITTLDLPVEAFTIQESEVEAIRWIEFDLFMKDLEENPDQYTIGMRNRKKLLPDFMKM
ncbi:MAG: NUDIX domain-containing protein [Patescibacteria group bacterium]